MDNIVLKFCVIVEQDSVLYTYQPNTYFVLAPSRDLFCACTKQTFLHQADLIYIYII